jgi:hypothetical protein
MMRTITEVITQSCLHFLFRVDMQGTDLTHERQLNAQDSHRGDEYSREGRCERGAE